MAVTPAAKQQLASPLPLGSSLVGIPVVYMGIAIMFYIWAHAAESLTSPSISCSDGSGGGGSTASGFGGGGGGGSGVDSSDSVSSSKHESEGYYYYYYWCFTSVSSFATGHNFLIWLSSLTTLGIPVTCSAALTTWVVSMFVWHAYGAVQGILDAAGPALVPRIAAYKTVVRGADKLSYTDMLPRVLFNQVVVALPATLALPLLCGTRGLRLSSNVTPNPACIATTTTSSTFLSRLLSLAAAANYTQHHTEDSSNTPAALAQQATVAQGACGVLGTRDPEYAPPGAAELILHVFGLALVYEIIFYYSHRWLHTAKGWPYHRLHHTTHGSVGISGQYASCLEFFSMQCGPVLAGALLLDTHLFSVCLFAIIGSLHSIHSHGGYSFPLFPPPDDHAQHHAKLKGNYGTGLLDRLHGTCLPPPILSFKSKKN